ncbi:unnamed protein product, partial [Brachionus calyciflorus]
KILFIYIGGNRLKNEYRIGSHTLKETTEEKDLGVIVSDNLKWNKQCNVAAAKANRILGQIKSSFVYLDRQIVRLLYIGLVIPHLEYAVKERRVRGYLIQMYKLINGLVKVKLVNGINYARSLAVNLRRPNNKIVNTWNNLAESAILAPTVDKFKSSIDRETFEISKTKCKDCNGSQLC